MEYYFGLYKTLLVEFYFMQQQRFPTPPIPGIPPHAVYKVDPGIAVPSPQSGPHPLVDDFHPVSISMAFCPFRLSDFYSHI